MKFYDLVKPQLEEVDQYLEKVLSLDSSYMYPLILEYLKRGGKRLRPALVLLTLGALGEDPRIGVTPASVLELFHNFTLIHDDIEDNSKMRRGKPTMNIAEGIPIALNAGDALYTLVWKSIFDLDLSPRKKTKFGILFANTFREVVEGQAIELKWYKDKKLDVTEKDYFNMIGKKTGALIESSCELGVLLSKKKKFLKKFRKYGRNIGIAFQIQDDVLNLIGEEEKYKKEIGGDITEGKRTLMVAYALGHLKEKEQQELKDILLSNTQDKDKILRAIELIKSSGGIEYAEKKAISLVEGAKSSLSKLDNSEYTSALVELADFVLKRSH